MASPPECPDLVLMLRDGTMLAMTSSTVGDLLGKCHLMPQSYNLPMYSTDEDPDALQLLSAISTDTVGTRRGDIPPLALLSTLAQLCNETGRLDLCESHVIPWIRRWIRSSWHALRAEVLEIALLCDDKRIILEVYRALVLAKLSDSELRRADRLIEDIPDSLRIGAMRSRLRRDLRTLLLLPIVDHPSIAVTDDNAHSCVLQAVDLVTFIKALREASLFPFPEEENELCLVELGERLHSIGAKMSLTDSCSECGFEGSRWAEKFTAIEKTLNAMLKRLMRDLETVFEEPSLSTPTEVQHF